MKTLADLRLPIQLDPEDVGRGLIRQRFDSAKLLLSATGEDRRITRLDPSEDEGGYFEAALALNCIRLGWRLAMEFGDESPGVRREFEDYIAGELAEFIGWTTQEVDGFSLTLTAKRGVEKQPFEADTLTQAWVRSGNEPLRLNGEGMNDPLVSRIAAVAYQLHRIAGPNKPIMLPREKIRKMTGRRKEHVTGAIRRLVAGAVLAERETDVKPGQAQEYAFLAVRGGHYDSPPLSEAA